MISLIESTAYLLAGKDSDARKIKDASCRAVAVINLNRLQKLLTGKHTFDSLKQLPVLTKKDFKGESYQTAERPSTGSQNTNE